MPASRSSGHLSLPPQSAGREHKKPPSPDTVPARNCIAQSYVYQLNSLERELGVVHISQTLDPLYPELMYWAGYVLSYWMFLDDITWQDLDNAYDIENVLQAYETLHTLSVERCIQEIKTNYSRVSMIRAKLGIP